MMRKHVWPESFYKIEPYGRFLYIPLLGILAFPLMRRFSNHNAGIMSIGDHINGHRNNINIANLLQLRDI